MINIDIGDVELLHNHLVVSPGQVVDAVCHAHVVVFINQFNGPSLRLCHSRDEVHP